MIHSTLDSSRDSGIGCAGQRAIAARHNGENMTDPLTDSWPRHPDGTAKTKDQMTRADWDHVIARAHQVLADDWKDPAKLAKLEATLARNTHRLPR